MIPLDVFSSESVAADLLQQVRWNDGVYCPCCRSDLTVKKGRYREFQRYLYNDCGRTFNDKTGIIFAHSKVGLRKWLFSIYAYLRFNASLRQLQCEIDVSYEAVLRRVERSTGALDAPTLEVLVPWKSTNCTLRLDSKATIATAGRARVG